MQNKENKKRLGLSIKAPLAVSGKEIRLSESGLELANGRNLIVHCERREPGILLIRAISGLERVSKGSISIKMDGKEFCLGQKSELDFFPGDLRVAYVSENGSDFCQDLTMMENLELIRGAHDPGFLKRAQELASGFMVEENMNDFPGSISVHRRKLFSIIRAWAYLPDIAIYADPLKHLSDLSSIEFLRNFSVSKLDSSRLNVIYTPSRGEFSTVLESFVVVEVME